MQWDVVQRGGRAAALLLLAMVAGCQPRNEFVPPPPPKVTVATPVSRDVRDYVEFTGTTKATGTVQLRARVNGYLHQINFEDGANVKQGDLLFVIEQAPFQAELEAAQAAMKKAEASLQLAEAEYARTVELFRRKVVSQQDLDVQKAQRATAQADVSSAEAEVTQAQLNLDYTEIRAPLSGQIGRHQVDEGNLVQAEQTLLATIESIDPIYAEFYISERELLRFMEMLREKKLNDPRTNPPELRLQIADEEGFPHVGRLDYRELGVDPGTGTILRRGIFPNDDLTLIPGLFVRIRAAVGEPEPRLLVESRALGADQRGDFLLVVNEKNEVEYRPVKLGIAVGKLRVIQSGIDADDRVVINGLQRARPGSTVDPELAQMDRETTPDAESPATSASVADGTATDEKAAAPNTGTTDSPAQQTE